MLALTPWLVSRVFSGSGGEAPELADFLPAEAGAAEQNRRTAADLFAEAWARGVSVNETAGAGGSPPDRDSLIEKP